MDVFVKKYFWVVNLAVIAACATLGGRAGAHLITGMALLPSGDAPPPARRFAPPSEPVRTKDVESIVHRNVFCSACKPLAVQGENVAVETPSGPQPPQRTGLNLELVSTMVVPSDERWSMAVIRDLSSKDKEAAMFAMGSKLPGGAAEVLRVIERKVYLRNEGRIEYLELEGANNPNPVAATPAPQMVVAASGDPMDDSIGNRVRCNGAACEIERSLVDQMLSNTTSLATAARFVPSIKDGRPNGFKLYAIRPSSIFGRIGLQNGDTIKAINGMDMTSPDQALGVYTKVRNASHLTVAVERRGETVTLDYTIR
jgi:general secretion pathway protein C